MSQTQTAARANRTICIYFCQEQYAVDIWDQVKFRRRIDQAFDKLPELFPDERFPNFKKIKLHLSPDNL
jgi:hypothetical protein